MFRFLGLSSDNSSTQKPTPDRGLPASWYRSQELYQLERRSIFSRKWILLTHKLRFSNPGEYLSFTYANFPFFLIQDKDGNINAFHNACRHRAYPIIQKESGTARVLSCKYHGWSYGLKGNLAKAPRFDSVPGFDKSQHGLFPIRVHVDRVGFVWVNLESGPGEPDVKWTDDFAGVDEQPRMTQFEFGEGYSYSHTWEMDLNSNWKGVMENYNECYHCPTSHPLIAGVSDLSKYTVQPNKGCLEHTIINKSAPEEEDDFRRSITFFFPSTSVTVTKNFFYIQRMIPTGAKQTKIQNEVYRHNTATDEEFAAINAFYKQVLDEDKELCNGTQGNLNAGIFINGELHPDKERGPIHFQQTVKTEVMNHRDKELKQGGKEIWPATPKLVGEMNTDKLCEEERFCSELEAAACKMNEELAWGTNSKQNNSKPTFLNIITMSDIEGIKKTLNAYGNALTSRIVDDAVSLYTADGVILPPHFNASIGTEALTEAYQRIFSSVAISVKFDFKEVVVTSPEWGFARTTAEGMKTMLATGESEPHANQELFVMKKEGNEWKIAQYAFSTMKPLVQNGVRRS